MRKDYYKDPTEDALVLWAHDVDTPAYADRLSVIESQLPTPLVLEDPPTPDVSSGDTTELDAL